MAGRTRIVVRSGRDDHRRGRASRGAATPAPMGRPRWDPRRDDRDRASVTLESVRPER